jgi:hypothetical protein
MNETENNPTQKMDEIQNKVNDLIDKIPFFGTLTEKIDSRSLFTSGMSLFLRLTAFIGLFIGTLVLLLAAFNALTIEGSRFEGSTKFFASVIDLSMFIVLIGGFLIIIKRSAQIKNLQNASVIDIAFSLVRISIEIVVLNLSFTMLVTGMLTVLLGSDASQVLSLALFYSIPEAISTITPTGDSAFWVRVGGLFTIIGSVFFGFFSLFAGYVGHDTLNIFYRFFSRK